MNAGLSCATSANAGAGAWKPERVFVVLASLMGLAFVFVTPPFEVNDEMGHCYKAFQVSEFHLFGEMSSENPARFGGYVPMGLRRLETDFVYHDFPIDPLVKLSWQRLRELASIPLEPDSRFFGEFPQARYPFLLYVPQALGMLAGRAAGLPALGLMYAGRLANLAVWMALVYTALRLMPCCRWFLLLYALTPMSLRQGASLSGDAVTNGVAFIYIAWVMRLAFAKETVSAKRLAVLCATVAVQLSCKPAYFLLPLFALIVPVRKFGGWRRYLAYGAIYAMVCLAAFLAIAALTAHGYKDAPPYSVHGQTQFIVHNPLTFAKILVTSMFVRFIPFPTITETFIGFQSWREPHVLLPGWGIVAFLLALFLTAIVEYTPGIRLSWLQRLFMAALSVASVALIFVMVYLHYNPVGAPDINTVWGRMLIPVLPLAFICLANGFPRTTRWNRWLSFGASGFLALALAVAVGVLAVTFYIPEPNLIPNGEFRDWPAEAKVPLGWDFVPEAANGAWSIERVADTTDPSSVQLKQTCLRSNSKDSISRQFGTTFSGLKPYSRYRFFCRASTPVAGALRVAAWEIHTGKSSQPAGPRRLSSNVIYIVNPVSGERFVSYAGEFYTKDSGLVRLVVTCEGPDNIYPFTVTWKEWALTRVSFGVPWRIYRLI